MEKGTLAIIVGGTLVDRERKPTRMPSRIVEIEHVPSRKPDSACDIRFQDGTLASCSKWKLLRPLTDPSAQTEIDREMAA